MTSVTDIERYAKAKEIFFAALEFDEAERSSFVKSKCGNDADLLAEIESLLALRVEAQDFLELPVIGTISPFENLKGEIIGGYRLIRELGAGGMGVVYLAEKEDVEFYRRVALKIVRNSLRSKSIFKRFNLEQQILAQLEHPNIARLIDGGTTADGLPFLIMEYVEGTPLIEYVRTNNLGLSRRLDLFRQICAAVSYAHRNAVIHRDLKPSNILVTEEGTVKLLDFGISKLLSSETLPQRETATTFRAMTPEYASPEQMKGEKVTTVSDIYSLGVILYELLTGERPYKINSDNLNEIIHAVCEVLPVAPSRICREAEPQRRGDTEKKTQVSTGIVASPPQCVPASQLKGDLDNIILKALRKEPERRYSSVEALDEDLQRHLKGLPVSARQDTFAYRSEKFIRRNRAAVALAALVILAILGGIAATIWQARRAEQERARAERRFNDVRALANSFMFELNDEILRGQTQARELVVKRALEYLDSLAAEAKDDVSLQRELAMAYLKIGDIQGKPYSPNLGDTDGALESYNKALTILESLHQSNPSSREIQFDLGMAYAAVGALQRLRLRKSEEAVETLQKSRALGEALVAAEPSNLKFRGLLADAYKFLGDSLPRVKERLEMHRKALSLREESLAANPTNIQENTAIASIYQRIGTIYIDIAGGSKNADDYRTSLENFNKSIAIYKRLQKYEPKNSRHRRNFADITAMRILVQANLGDKTGVMEGYQTALGIFQELAAADPKNTEAILDIVYSHHFLCRSLLIFNDDSGAVRSCRQGIEVGESLLEIDPTNAEARYCIFYNYNSIANTLKKNGDYSGLIKNLNQWFTVAEKLYNAEPRSYDALFQPAGIAIRIGEAHFEIALNKANSSRKKRQHLQTACHWFERSRNFLDELQNRFGLKEGEMETVEMVRQKNSQCNKALE